MNAPVVDAKINAYKQKIETLDTIAKNIPSEHLTKYQVAKYRYEQRLNAWQQTLSFDLATFNTNVSEGFDELEAELLAARNK